MGVTGKNLSAKQEKAVAALISEPTTKAAAATAGIGENTLFRWLREPDFQDAYREARRQVVSHAIARLQQASEAAVLVLHHIMLDQKTKPSSRIAAARAILDTAIRGQEMEDLEVRIKALEDAQQGSGVT